MSGYDLSEKALDGIKEAGVIGDCVEMTKRDRIVREKLGFHEKDRAEYVVLASCIHPYRAPEDMLAFRKLLDILKVDYTLLPHEYCCGGSGLYLQALRAKNRDAEERVEKIADDFQQKNLKQVEKTGAKKIAAFCAGCDMLYKRLQYPQKAGRLPATTGRDPGIEIIWYPTLLDRFFKHGRLDMEADYYSGCHVLYGKYSPSAPVDLQAPRAVLDKVEGLRLNTLDGSLCCVVPEQSDKLLDSMETKVMITPCAACRDRMMKLFEKRGGDIKVLSLSQALLEAVGE